jgi:hypothetical protein
MEYLFNFDNSEINEDVSEIIDEKFHNDKNKLVKIKLKNDLILNLFKYKNKFPLILEEVKPLFDIPKTRYNIITIDNQKYYAYKNSNSICLKEYLKYNEIKNSLRYREIQLVIIFNYLMCVNNNFENKILVFPNYVKSSIIDTKYSDFVIFKVAGEKSYKYDHNESRISKRILKEWFDDSEEEFQEMSYRMVKAMDADLLRWELKEIVFKYDSDYVSWINSVYNKIVHAKNIKHKKDSPI